MFYSRCVDIVLQIAKYVIFSTLKTIKANFAALLCLFWFCIWIMHFSLRREGIMLIIKN